jgi:hypothetical protein
MYRATPATWASANATDDDEVEELPEAAYPFGRPIRKRARHDNVVSEPQLRLLADDEVIDVEPVRKEFMSIQDKVDRLLQTLEHERREKAILKKKYNQLCDVYRLQEQA